MLELGITIAVIDKYKVRATKGPVSTKVAYIHLNMIFYESRKLSLPLSKTNITEHL